MPPTIYCQLKTNFAENYQVAIYRKAGLPEGHES